MSFLPLIHKAQIQASYVRFRELKQQLPGHEQLKNVGLAAFCIGLFVLVGSFVKPGWPDFLQGSSAVAVIAGWFFYRDQKKKYFSAFTEMLEINKAMRPLNVYFSDTFQRITVYSGEISDENSVDPLYDNHYR
jgi:hypothetical protein